MNSKLKNALLILLVFLAVATSAYFVARIFKEKKSENMASQKTIPNTIQQSSISEQKDNQTDEGFVYHPGPISMDVIKKQGCVADGILSGYGNDTDKEVAMINRSNCLYLHRALETWGSPPDFERAREVMQKITKPNVIYGMFIAENLQTNADQFYGYYGQEFNFSAMCKNGTENRWGLHTCIPDFDRKEYRDYLEYITHRAMDLGIQSFLFGQVYYQNGSDDKITKVVADMRDYAQKKGLSIVIGAQTGDITDENFLRQFDYIEGGVGIGDSGQIENGPCWSQMSSCWALLWNEKYASKANNVLLALDWSGLKFDDMSSLVRMDKSKRAQVLKNLYNYFINRQMGFLMPMMATLNANNGGCKGPKDGLYSASNDYTCRDEGAINSILPKVKI